MLLPSLLPLLLSTSTSTSTCTSTSTGTGTGTGTSSSSSSCCCCSSSSTTTTTNYCDDLAPATTPINRNKSNRFRYFESQAPSRAPSPWPSPISEACGKTACSQAPLKEETRTSVTSSGPQLESRTQSEAKCVRFSNACEVGRRPGDGEIERKRDACTSW